MKKGALKGIVCLVVIVVIWMAVSFRSKPLSDEGEISLENFVVCRVQVMEIKNDTGYGRKTAEEAHAGGTDAEGAGCVG